MSNLIPEGRYTAVAVAQDGEDGLRTVRWGIANDKKQCLVYFEVLEGENKGERVPWFGYFTQTQCGETTVWERTVQSLKYCGFKGENLADIENQNLNQKVQIVVEHNENPKTGKVHPRVSWVNRLGAGSIKLANPMSGDDLRHFSAQMKSYLSRVKDVDGEPVERGNGVASDSYQASYQEPPPVAEQEDDIPF